MNSFALSVLSLRLAPRRAVLSGGRRSRLLLLAAVSLVAACGGGREGEGEGQADNDRAVMGSAAADQEDGRSRILAATANTSNKLGAAPADSGAPVTFTRIVVRAGSTRAEGIGALLQVRYNGVVVASAEVTSAAVDDLAFNVETMIDGGMLDVVFTNASFANGSPARVLTITSVKINGTPFSPTGPGVSYDLGHGPEAFDGIAVVPGATSLGSTGALRLPMPAASQLGAPSTGVQSDLSSDPGPYVDVNDGSDANPGTALRPYKTLGRLLARQLLVGENIHLRCGNIWRESLALGVSQLSAGTQIVPYGSDCAQAGRPVISGANVFNGGWVSNGTIWSRNVPAGTPKITRVWVGNTAMRPAQWPNAGAPQALVRATYAPDPWRFWMADADAAALAGRDLRGATVMLRTQPWKIEVRRVAEHGSQGSEVAISINPEYTIQPGDAWLLRDKQWMLDAPGEFFHDVAAGRLYLIPATADAALNINTATIEASVRATALEVRGRSRVVVRGLALRNTQQDGLRLTDAPEARLSDIESRENGVTGVRLMQWESLPESTPGPRVESSLFVANGEFGIDATYVRGATIQGNSVTDTGVSPGMDTGPATAAIAAGPAATVINNIVDGAAYAAIMFSSKGPTVVSGNEISHYCIRLTDCGAIYTWSAQTDVSPQQGSLIERNRIYGAVAASQGSPALDDYVVAGIYLDDYTQRATVRNNFLQNMPIGIFLHNTARTLVEDNQIWLARRVALSVSMDRYDADWSTANILRNNEIVPMTTASSVWPALPTFAIAQPIWFVHALAGQAALGVGRNEFSNNRVVQLNGVIPEHALITGPSGQQLVDVARWRQLNPGEPDVQRPLTFSPYYLALGPEKVQGGQFDGGLGSWARHWNWQINGYDVQAAWTQPGCTGPCVRLTVADGGDAIMSPTFTMQPGVPHVYRWTALATGSAATVGQAYIARPDTWDNMNDSSGFVTLSSRQVKSGEVQQFEAFFTPKSNVPAKVLLQMETSGVPVHFDAVSVREVLGWWFSGPREWASAVVAPKDAPRTINSCGELGWPADCRLTSLSGSAVSLPFTVASGSQRMVLWANSAFRR